MKRILFALLGGMMIIGLITLYGIHPRNGPTLGIIVFIIPFQILARVIGFDGPGPIGEVVYFGLQVIFWSFLSYPFLLVFKKTGSKDDLKK